jgi:hypothetical protein
MSLTRASASVIKTEEIVGTRNRIINGAMEIDQRNAGASVTPADNSYTLDRWLSRQVEASSKFSVQQSSTVPTGFNNSLLVTSLSAYSVSAADFFAQEQRIEGFNTADLQWGTVNAKIVTLSFWVRSSLTGTFGGALRNGDNNRSYPFTYTISAADTWEQKTITVAGDTSGSWNKTNGIGLRITFGLGVGSTNSGTAGSWAGTQFLSATGATSVVGTNGATWYLTGVQLEVGSTATPFERRQFGTELALCQRYFYRIGGSQSLAGVTAYDATTVYDGNPNPYPVPMRVTPTITNSGTFTLNDGLGSSQSVTPAWTIQTIGFRPSGVGFSSGLVTGRTYYLTLNSNVLINISAEL